MKRKHIVFIPIFLIITLGAKQGEVPVPKEIMNLLTKNTCVTCHNAYKRVIGPSFLNISKRQYSAEQIASLIANPQPADWPGYPAMAPLNNVPFEDIKKITAWINGLK